MTDSAEAGSRRSGRVEGVRAPDHWSALRSADPPAASPAGETTSEEAVAEPAAAETAAEGPGSEAPAGRLGRGALGALVRDYLAARPADAFGPAEPAQGAGAVPGGGVQRAGPSGGER